MPYKDKEAQRKYHQRYYHENKDRIVQNSKKADRLENRSAYLTRYNEDNRELIAISQAVRYQNNKEVYKERVRKRFQEHSLLVANIKRHYGCMNDACGWQAAYDPAMLDFHHCDPKDKSGNINQMLGYSKARLSKEINKCLVLCANCHRLCHCNNSQFTEHCVVNEELMVCD